MTAAPALTLDDVCALFSPSVRVEIQWSALRRQDAPISHTAILDRRHLAALRTVWYLSADGSGETHHDATDTPSMTISEAVACSDQLDPTRQQRMKHLAGVDLESSVLQILCYTIPDGLIILDGNHRACALYARGAEKIRLLATVIHGPPDPEILPDLRHWARQ